MKALLLSLLTALAVCAEGDSSFLVIYPDVDETKKAELRNDIVKTLNASGGFEFLSITLYDLVEHRTKDENTQSIAFVLKCTGAPDKWALRKLLDADGTRGVMLAPYPLEKALAPKAE